MVTRCCPEHRATWLAVLRAIHANATLLLAATFGLAYPQISDTTSPTLAEDLNDLGSVHFDQARLLDAERCFDEAISIWTKRGSSSPKIGFAFLNLAQLRVEQNRPSDGEKLFRRAREILGSAFGTGSVDLAVANIGLANALMHLHRTAEAETAARLALAALETRANTEHLGAALFLLAKAAWIQRRGDDAEALLRRAIEVWRALLGSQHPTFASGLVCRGTAIGKALERIRQAPPGGAGRFRVATRSSSPLYRIYSAALFPVPEATRRKAGSREAAAACRGDLG
jgi:tetratricopeptide (TPR) repeat protein